MADITLYSRVNNLYYSSEEWSILNPVLQKGEIGFDTTNRNYKVGDGSTNWNNLPFFPLVSQASATTLGGIKVGFPESGKNYPVELNSSGQAFVNVPWTDNNTTYSPGTGISISGTTINHANYGQATTYGRTNNASASFGGGITLPYIITNAQGHVTGGGIREVTLPAAPTSVSGNAGTATKLQTARTISLAGDVTGSASFDGSANVSITATVANDSHNHTIANVDGLQTALNGKLSTSGTAANSSKLGGLTLANLRSYGYIMTAHTIDARSLNENTYYPVTMALSTNKQYLFLVENVISSSSNKPSWSTHTNGFNVRKMWSSNGSGWGAATVKRLIYLSDASWIKDDDDDPVRGIGQLNNSSVEYVYVRGGGSYTFWISPDVTPVLRTSTYTTDNQSVAPTTTKPARIYPTVPTTGSAYTVGSSSQPVYVNNGVITACSSTIGAATKPVYMSGGTITACSGNVGSASTPIYINNGTFTACSSLSAGVTVSDSTSNIYVLGTTTTGSLSTLNRASGVYISSGTKLNASGGFFVQSARKYKKDIVDSKIDAVKMVNDTKVVEFHYKNDEKQVRRIGFIADDTDPLLSTPEQDKMDTTNCIGILLKAVQELDIRLRRLEA